MELSGASFAPHKDLAGNLPRCWAISRMVLEPSIERDRARVPEVAEVQHMPKKRIGILTGGGDVPGLNSVIKTVTYRGSEDDIEVIGLRRGWEGLTHLNCDDPASRRRYILPLDRENTRTIDRRGVTVLHSSRTNPSKMQKLPDHLSGKDFPVSLDRRSSTASETWDLSQQVLA